MSMDSLPEFPKSHLLRQEDHISEFRKEVQESRTNTHETSSKTDALSFVDHSRSPFASHDEELNTDHHPGGMFQRTIESEDLTVVRNEGHNHSAHADSHDNTKGMPSCSSFTEKAGPLVYCSTSDLNQCVPSNERSSESRSFEDALPTAAIHSSDGLNNVTEKFFCESDASKIPLLSCDYCNGSFADEKILSDHLKKEHFIEGRQDTLVRNVSVNLGSASVSSRDTEENGDNCAKGLKEDFDMTTLSRFMSFNKCIICSDEFKFRSILLNHMRDCHNGVGEDEVKNRAMMCMFCSETFFDEFMLLKHESCHPEMSEAIKCLECGESIAGSTSLTHQQQMVSKDVICSACLKKSPNNVSEASHTKNLHNPKGEARTIDVTVVDGDNTEKDDISSGTSTPLGKHRKLRCRFCSKKCSHKKSLLKHEMSHPDGTAAIKCDRCLEVLENYKELKIHKKPEALQVMCSICSIRFPNQKCLSNHARNTHCTFDDENSSNSAEDTVNVGGSQSVDDDENYSSEGSSVYLDALPRYTISDSGEPLRITIKQEKEDNPPYSPHSFTSSSATPPTPPTPSPKGPPTPSPPPFPTYVEESSEVSEEESSDQDDSSYTSQSTKKNISNVSRRKSSLRTPRKVLPSDVYFESSSEASGNDDPSDFLYTPKASSWKEPEEENESDDDPDWGNSLSYVRKRSAVLDDESDDDPDWRKVRNSVSNSKKKVSRGRGRGKKKPVEDFPRLVQPKVRRPRARGCGGQKAQDAAAALAEAVDEMECSMPELKVVIRPLKRSLGGSITKASVKRYSDVLENDSDYLVDVKAEGNYKQQRPDESTSVSEVELKSEQQKVGDKSATFKDVYSFDEDEQKEEAENVVIKLEPHEVVGDDFPKYSELSSGDTSHGFEESFELTFNSAPVGEDVKEIRYICKFCGRELQYRSHLLRHLRRVHGGEGVDEVMRRLMKCRFCSKQYSNELSLIHHEKLHDGTNKIKCNKCEEVFDDKNALRRHQRKIHWEHQPVECSVCKKQLADNTCLKAHMKHMHTAEERKVTVFTCETCGRQLHTKTAFQNHVASKCGTNLLFPCETCGKSFSFKGSLKAHQLLHTGVKSFLCRFCGKSFHQKGEMKRHERKHTGEKPFVCTVCGRAFAYRESLLGHSAVHTGIKPFPCKACGMRFSCSGNLVKHRRSNNCKGLCEKNDASSPSVGTITVNTSSEGTLTNPSNGTTPTDLNTSCASSIQMRAASVAETAKISSSCASKSVFQSAPSFEVPSVNTSPAHSTHRLEVQTLTARVNNPSGFNIDPQSFLSDSMRANTTSSHSVESLQIPSTFSCPLPLRSSYNAQNNFDERKLDSVIQSSTQDRRETCEMKSSVPLLPASSVIKTNPVIAAMKSVPVSSPLMMNMNLKTEPQDEVNQSYGMNYMTNRSSAQTSTMYDVQDSNNLLLHNAYGAHSISTTYGENQYRALNHNSISERHFSQFSTDGRIGRNDSLFDRESIIRQEMNRQVIERTVDRQASRLLDCFNGVQFGGIDRRNPMQSFSAATSVGHPAAYSNIHPSHFNNYAAAHTGSSTNSHTSMYATNTMVPGQVNFANFPGSSHLNMSQNNQIPAHSVSHPATHMGHLGAFFGHFGHSPVVHPSNSFSRYALTHNMGSPPNPSFPGNHRM